MSSADSRPEAISVHIAEYNALRTEIMEHNKLSAQILIYGLVSLGVAIPMLAESLQNNLYDSLLAVPAVFASLSWVYVGYQGAVYRICIYLDLHLRPVLNGLLNQDRPDSSKTGHKNDSPTPSAGEPEDDETRGELGPPISPAYEVLAWERFARRRSLLPLTWPRTIELLLLFLPSAVSLALYVVLENRTGVSLNGLQWAIIVAGGAFAISPLLGAIGVSWFGFQVFRGRRSM